LDTVPRKDSTTLPAPHPITAHVSVVGSQRPSICSRLKRAHVASGENEVRGFRFGDDIPGKPVCTPSAAQHELFPLYLFFGEYLLKVN